MSIDDGNQPTPFEKTSDELLDRMRPGESSPDYVAMLLTGALREAYRLGEQHKPSRALLDWVRLR
jgi:hypothetical protein